MTDRKGSHWEWEADELDDTSTLLRKLDNPTLSIDTSDLRASACNPYDHAAPPERG